MAKRSSISENEAKYSEAETEQELETEEEESEDDEEEQRGKRIVIRVVSGDRRGVQLRSQLASSGFDSGSTHNGNGGGYLGCQADECGTDLRDAKAYHRRHKVCERHAKAPVVLVKGIRQRFCQQCSRFHEISQFDHNKRSCRSRLAGHNERRRKMQCQLQGKDEGGSLGSQTNSSSRLEASGHPSQGQMMNSNPKHVRIK